MKIPKELRTEHRLARERGWTITIAGDGHVKWTSPEGAIVTTAHTFPRSGRGRSLNNAQARLRKAGLR
jgi:hypothetical protein